VLEVVARGKYAVLSEFEGCSVRSIAVRRRSLGRIRLRKVSGEDVLGHRAGRRILSAIVFTVLAGPAAFGQELRADEDDPSVAAIRASRQLDPLYEIREYFRRELPFGWWASEPEKFLGGYQVTLNIPKDWAGNPHSAAMSYCPDRTSEIWQVVRRLYIETRYHGLNWAGVECRS
tara:strand:- start:1225 stop:1749 length:525 start_codon:yes stop_codon:yes gene_type:complete